jgi:multimeric flavodoxin WrbA
MIAGGLMTNFRPKLLGIAASLRNARWGAGNRHLIDALMTIPDRPALDAFLTRESELHLENFVQAGRRDKKPFVEIYRNLRKSNGEVGLSNSEVALAAALWSARQEGTDVAHLSLSEYFTANGDLRNGDSLRRELLQADGVLVSGPVYFGDRGSLAESLVDFISRDPDLRAAMAGRLYAGIAVGAKRNGGQETTLIYQMIDMLGLGFIAVGNDSDTTAQYGGTGHAGDVGTMHKDKYGIETSMGVGRRMAKVLATLNSGERLADAPRVLFLVLQDADGIALRETKALVARLGPRVKPSIINITDSNIKRCIACDICPTNVDLDEVYRCIIKSAGDDFSDLHPDLLHHDALVPVVASPRDRSRVVGNYQTFIERSRYLRRGDYVWSDMLVAPLSFVDSIGYDSYSIRMMTSFLRHHTVMAKPMIGQLVNGHLVNADQIMAEFPAALAAAERLTCGRLAKARSHDLRYRPVGYILSADKDAEDEKMQRRAAMIEGRTRTLQQEALARLLRNAIGS